ncbi:uncharacterized protein [Rutidosis leptorrhynchoides]|uniref:uncharacterized protein n=1 Tax=Rutidosis leptorrhynchoides TaxID=125765 RepID=UPI003A9A552B
MEGLHLALNRAVESNYIRGIKEIFYLVSGLRINVAKSHIFGIGVDSAEVCSYAAATSTRVGSFPTKYLGIPIGSNMKHSNWDSLVDKFRNKLSSWKASLISSGGRLTLVKSVMGNIGICFMSLFKCPEKVLIVLESIRARFFGVVIVPLRKFHG